MLNSQSDDIDYHTKLLTKVTSVAVIDLLKYAMSFNDLLLSNLIEPKKGLYIKGTTKLLIDEMKPVYAVSDTCYEKPLSFDEVLDSKESIVDINGKRLIKASFCAKRRDFFTIENPPYITAVKVVKAIALQFLNTLCPHYKGSLYSKNYSEFIKPESSLFDSIKYEEALDSLYSEINSFIGDDREFIYFHKFLESNLIIEKTVDYRIYKYYERLHQDAINANNENCNKCRHCRF